MCPSCSNIWDIPYINNLTYNPITSSGNAIYITIPYTEITDSIIPGTMVTKWSSILTGGIANAISQNSYFRYITPMNIIIEFYETDSKSNGTIVYYTVTDTDNDNGTKSQYIYQAINSLFLPNSGTSIQDPSYFVDNNLSTAGCPVDSCTSSRGIAPNIICQPADGCKDNGILSSAIRRYMNGTTGTRAIDCYYNISPSSNMPTT
jgi:hypothetical protein